MKIIAIILLLPILLLAQNDAGESTTEIFVIDSYITPEKPNQLVLSFFTTDSTTSKVKLMNKYIYDVSNKLEENHKFTLELSEIKLDSLTIPYKIFIIDKNGNETISEEYYVEITKDLEIKENQDPGFIQTCCFGGIIFAFPSPSLVIDNGNTSFSLSKELPLFTFYSQGYNYPKTYVATEYTYVFRSEKKHYLKLGVKQIFDITGIEFISAGLSVFTSFEGSNGISPEVTFGLFKIENVFTLYTRYNYNYGLDKDHKSISQFSIGLYSHFFSLNL